MIINLVAIFVPFASLASLFLLGLDRLAIKLSGITSLVGGVIGIIRRNYAINMQV